MKIRHADDCPITDWVLGGYARDGYPEPGCACHLGEIEAVMRDLFRAMQEQRVLAFKIGCLDDTTREAVAQTYGLHVGLDTWDTIARIAAEEGWLHE